MYEYSKSGQIVARTANGVRQTYAYDKKGQLLAVKDAEGNAVERYAYDKAGNMLKKTVGGKTTTFTFDDANQLVSSTTDGVTTFYSYDAAGRLVTEGNKTYRYGYLDKVMSVSEGDKMRTYTYHADGQLATANNERADANRSTVGRGDPTAPQSETFLWDGLALVRRNDEQFMNEPHIGGGNPVASSKGTSYFNDVLGTTVGFKSNGKYSAAALTAFGEDLTVHSPTPTQNSNFFTGKPYVEGLGHAFLMRNYRASLAKWQTADPLGYPDGWNQLAYGYNSPYDGVDRQGGAWGNLEMVMFYFRYAPSGILSTTALTFLTQLGVLSDYIDTDVMGLTNSILQITRDQATGEINEVVGSLVRATTSLSGTNSVLSFSTGFSVPCGSICFALGGGSGSVSGTLTYSWNRTYAFEAGQEIEYVYYFWNFEGEMRYSDEFKDPVDVGNWIDIIDIESPYGVPYSYGHVWNNISLSGLNSYRLVLE
jgi:RHS repeat-associated protein